MSKEIIVTVKTDTKQTDAKLNKVNKNLKKTEKQAKETGTAMSSAFNALPASIQGAVGQIKNLGTSFKAIAVGAGVGAIAGLGSLFVTATKRGAEFAKSLSGLEAVLGASDSEMNELSNSAKELGASTQFTSKQVVELQTEFAKLGFSTKEILASTKATLDLAASLDVGLGEAASIAGSTLRAFGLEAEETQRVVDVMASSTSKSALDYDALRESLKLVAPTSRAMNVSIEETTALLATLADNGLKGSVAGTGLSKTFIELNKEGIPLKEALDRVKNSSNQLNTAIDLVGVVGAKSLLTLANNAPKIDNLTTAFENSQGAAQRLAETRLDNLAGDTTKLSSAWEGFLLSIEDGEGIFNSIARGIVQATTSLLNFITPTEKVSESLEKERTSLFRVQAELGNVNTTQEERTALILELQKKYPEYLKNIDAETASNEDLNKAIQEINKSLINKILIQEKEEEIQEQAEETADELNNVLEKEANLLEYTATLRKKYSDLGFEIKANSPNEVLDELNGIIKKQNDLRLEGNDKNKLNIDLIAEGNTEIRRLEQRLKSLNKAEQDYQEELEKGNKFIEEKNALMDRLGISTEEVTDKQEDNNDALDELSESTEEVKEKTRDRIKLLEEELKKIQDREAISDMEIAQRNDEVKAIQQQIKALRELSVEDLKRRNRVQQDLPEMQSRNAQIVDTTKEQNDILLSMQKNYVNQAKEVGEQGVKDAQDQFLRKQQFEEDLARTKSRLLQQGLENLIMNTEAESKVNKAALVAKHIIMVQELVMEASKTITFSAQVAARSKMALVEGKAQTAKVGFPQNIPLLIGYGLQAAGIIISLKNALKTAKAPINIPDLEDDSGAGGGVNTQTQPPEFNVVGQSGVNQIAGAFAGAGPVQAFVVSGDVTTAQQLQNNTIQQATF